MAVDLDGATGFISHGDIAALNTPAALTIAFWLYYASTSLNDHFVQKTSATTDGWAVRSLVAVNDFAMWFGGATPDSGRAVGGLATGVWNYWACRYDGAGALNADRLKIYRDGTELALTFGGTVPAVVVDSSGTQMLVGRDAGTAHAAMRITGLMIWTAALSVSEIAAQRLRYRPVRTSNLRLWSPYLDGVAAGDYSGSGNHGSSAGAVVSIAGPSEVAIGAPSLMA